MGVSNNQYANEDTFNDAFMDKNDDTFTTGVVTLQNIDAPSGDTVENIQRELNANASFTGQVLDQLKTSLPTWASDIVGAAFDSIKMRVEALVALFDGTSGHTHDGSDGNGPLLSPSVILEPTLHAFYYRATDLTGVTGSSVVVTTQMAGKIAYSTGDPTPGVNTGVGVNLIILKSAVDTLGKSLRDASGKRIFGRLTELAGVWTLSFYTETATVESAYTFAVATNIAWYYSELYNPIDNDPSASFFSDLPYIESDTDTGELAISGTRASPYSVVAGTGILAPTAPRMTYFIQGSGGAVDVSANPQMAAGTFVGQEAILIGRSDTNTVFLEDGTGLDLNGPWLGGASSVLSLVYDGTNWVERSRR